MPLPDPLTPAMTRPAGQAHTAQTSHAGPAGQALASWSEETVDVQLIFDAGSAHLASVGVEALVIQGFQAAARFQPGETITIEPNSGLLLTIGY
ncbi:glycoside hydrolase domain-containing protein [Paenarthrobacter sp. NPDC089322]|uniref:glycoside hydrolase domain-containing protein n=1 Tax=Paenarthrobacter sp. NPDC089322 TaxID=3155065 RepID=UPI00344025D0